MTADCNPVGERDAVCEQTIGTPDATRITGYFSDYHGWKSTEIIKDDRYENTTTEIYERSDGEYIGKTKFYGD
jgi:hypothetical protein